MESSIVKISILYLILLGCRTVASEFRILSLDKCTANEKYITIEQCEASGNFANVKANFITTIDSIIVGFFPGGKQLGVKFLHHFPPRFKILHTWWKILRNWWKIVENFWCKNFKPSCFPPVFSLLPIKLSWIVSQFL